LQNKKKKVVQTLFKHSFSIHFDRVLEISNQLRDAVVQRFIVIGVVCPTQMKKEAFTLAAVDNIGPRPTAATATTSFHGTSISLFQSQSAVIEQEPLTLSHYVKSLPQLPENYTNVKPAYL